MSFEVPPVSGVEPSLPTSAAPRTDLPMQQAKEQA